MTKKVLLSLLVLALVQISTFAHPPSKVKLEFNNDTKTLNIEAYHNTKDVSKHYIDEIVVSVNGEEFKLITKKSQTDKDKQVAEVKIPNAKAGNIIEVTAKCNKFGSKSAKLTIE